MRSSGRARILASREGALIDAHVLPEDTAAGVRSGPEPSWARNFRDASRWWRRTFAEVLGTFLLVLGGVGSSVAMSVTGMPISRTAAVTVPGLTVMAVILFMGKVGGAHLNPVVSIAFALRGAFPWRRVPAYVLAQRAGGVLACLFLWAVFGRPGTFGATVTGTSNGELQLRLHGLNLTKRLTTIILR